MVSSMINVTKPYLAPEAELSAYLKTIWKNGILTNGGPLHQQLEDALRRYLSVENLSLYSNGTLALKAAVKVLGLTGEVITTPFSFVATANVLIDCGLTPVFVDIDPETFNIDPKKIEAAITDKTSGIMPVHVYGTPCDVEAIAKIARERNLKVIYDAAHAFNVQAHGQSILNYGDASALSFHATKVYHTVEGGALALGSKSLKVLSDQYKNFGFTGELTAEYFGINAKMNEVQSAVGILNLKYIDDVFASRKKVFDIYNEAIRGMNGITSTHAALNSQNFSYYPILVSEGHTLTRDEIYESLKQKGINCRRYFYPIIPNFSVYRDHGYSDDNLPIARDISSRILCLPVYAEMSDQEAQSVVSALKQALGS